MNGREIAKLFAPIMRRLALMLNRITLSRVNAATQFQEVQVVAMRDEVLDGVEHFESYGFTSHPLPGAEGLLASLGGRRSHAVAVLLGDRRFRLRGLQSGEVALYTDEGDVIHFKRGNHIFIDSNNKVTVKAPDVDITATNRVLVTSPLATFTGDVHVDGALSVDGNIDGEQDINAADQISDATGTMQGMRDTYNTHTHPENDLGGPTSAPNELM